MTYHFNKWYILNGDLLSLEYVTGGTYMKKYQKVSLILTIVFTIILSLGLIGCDIENNRDIKSNLNLENNQDPLTFEWIEKIHYYLYNEYVPLNTLSDLRVKINENDIESTSVIILFDIDLFESTEEGRALREEEKYFNNTTTHDVINDWIFQWRTGSYLHYENSANNILDKIEFSSEVLLANLTPWAILTTECSEVLYNDILSFAKNINVISVSVYAGEEKFEDGNRNGDLDG